MGFSIPILMYHQVSDDPHPNFLKFTVTKKSFESQMKTLKLLGYNAINFSRLVSYKEGRDNLPGRPVIITFDDGFQEAVDNAVPILNSCGFTAVFYITTDYMGKKSSWMIPETSTEFQVIDWSTVVQLDSCGYEIGAHSMTHPRLDNISKENCYRELRGSREAIEEVLGHEVRHMAYPHGSFNDDVLKLTRETGYETSCSCESAVAHSGYDFLTLPRINIETKDSLFDFVYKLRKAKTLNDTMLLKINYVKSKIPGRLRRFIKKFVS
jgi:peptidoglycan/xylan/chitin deacetylase (PgdA/CDA1 family)